MPGVKAILTADDLPAPADAVNDNGQLILANIDGEVALTKEPVYQGQPILAVAAVDEVDGGRGHRADRDRVRAAALRGRSVGEPASGRPQRRTKGNYWFIPPPAPAGSAASRRARRVPRSVK